jgi:hypothetical protein
MEDMRNPYNNFVENMKERNNLEYQDVDSRIRYLIFVMKEVMKNVSAIPCFGLM